MWIVVLQRMVLEFVIDLLYFPIWWYTGGAKHAAIFCYNLLQDGNMFLSPGLWLKNMFVPMFGQTDFQGRMMSIFMRFVNFVGRSIGMIIWFFVCLFWFALWFLLPIFVIYMFVMSLQTF